MVTEVVNYNSNYVVTGWKHDQSNFFGTWEYPHGLPSIDVACSPSNRYPYPSEEEHYGSNDENEPNIDNRVCKFMGLFVYYTIHIYIYELPCI